MNHDVAALFGSQYGGQPDGVWSAPGRVNLVGEHTDYNQGLCLPIALPHRTSVAARRRGDLVVRAVSAQADDELHCIVDDIAPGHPGGWGAYVAGVVWALRQAGHVICGADLAIDSTLPLGAGLSSSAAIECAVAAAITDLAGGDLLASEAGRRELAQVCVQAENAIVGAPTGGMDQTASMLARPGHALLLDCRTWEAEHIAMDLERAALSLLVVDTRSGHQLVDGQYAARRHDCELAARELGAASLREVPVEDVDAALSALKDQRLRARARHVVTEIQRVRQAVDALARDDFATLGAAFVSSHASLRDDFEVSCPELDTTVDVAMSSGALGARMTGGGFGGSAIALVEATAAEHVALAIIRAFDHRGYRRPHCFVARPSGPADRGLADAREGTP